MADLIAIGYDDEITAALALDDLERSRGDLRIELDAVATVVRDGDGAYRTQTNHLAVGCGTSWGMAWEPLFGFLFFVPVCGMAAGPGLEASMIKVGELELDPAFKSQVRDALQPGTSAIFMLVDGIAPSTAIDGLGRLGGLPFTTALSSRGASELQGHLHGGPVTSTNVAPF